MTHDWNAIRKDYEQGSLSQSALAKKYDVSRTAIQKKATKEAWTVAGCRLQVAGATMPPPPQHIPLPSDATTIARIGLQQLAQHLQTETILEIKDHKSLSDALAQYVKVLVTAPQEDNGQEEEGLFIPLEKLSPDTRREIRRLLAEDEQKRRVG
jgi:hypothetical protein